MQFPSAYRAAVIAALVGVAVIGVGQSATPQKNITINGRSTIQVYPETQFALCHVGTIDCLALDSRPFKFCLASFEVCPSETPPAIRVPLPAPGEVKKVPPNLSLNPDHSPAALARRPLAAG